MGFLSAKWLVEVGAKYAFDEGDVVLVLGHHMGWLTSLHHVLVQGGVVFVGLEVANVLKLLVMAALLAELYALFELAEVLLIASREEEELRCECKLRTQQTCPVVALEIFW